MEKIRRMLTEKEFEEFVKEHGAKCGCHGELKREDIVIEEVFEE